MFGETPRDLTLDDAEALFRSHHIAAIAPLDYRFCTCFNTGPGTGNQHIWFDLCVKESAPFDDGHKAAFYPKWMSIKPCQFV